MSSLEPSPEGQAPSSAQVKVPADLKREIGIFAKITGRTQGQLLADAWAEYREKHKAELRKGLRWAERMLADPAAAAVAASGMEDEVLDELAQEFSGEASGLHPEREQDSDAQDSDAPAARSE